jgi:hypothetical protein
MFNIGLEVRKFNKCVNLFNVKKLNNGNFVVGLKTDKLDERSLKELENILVGMNYVKQEDVTGRVINFLSKK